MHQLKQNTSALENSVQSDQLASTADRSVHLFSKEDMIRFCSTRDKEIIMEIVLCCFCLHIFKCLFSKFMSQLLKITMFLL